MPRPRSFLPEEALIQLKNLFWLKGFEATSMQDIEQATGLKKQSLYRLFGNKRQMYLQALLHYESHEVANGIQLLLQQGTTRERITRFFDHFLKEVRATADSRGCFFCSACSEQAPSDPTTREHVFRMMNSLCDAFDTALAQSAPWQDDPALRHEKACHLVTTFIGLRTITRGGLPLDMVPATIANAIADL